VGGPSQSTQNQQAAITSQQLDISKAQEAQSEADVARRNKLEAPAINFLTGVTSGDRTSLMTALAPLVSNVTSGATTAKEQILDTTSPGAARDLALSNLEQNTQSSVANLKNTTFTGALDKLANIGAGLGSFSLQETGAALSGLTGASSSNQALANMQGAGKSSTLDFLGTLAGAAAGGIGAAIKK